MINPYGRYGIKKLCWVLAAVICLSGCGSTTEPVMETVADGIVEPVEAESKPIAVWLPEEAAAQTVADGTECYTWGETELRIQTMAGGDIRATLRTLTGLDPEQLTVMEYERDGIQLYQTVWSCTSEAGVSLGRCMVADDGNYHYCISMVSPEDAQVGETYARICASLDLSGEGKSEK